MKAIKRIVCECGQTVELGRNPESIIEGVGRLLSHIQASDHTDQQDVTIKLVFKP
jgi:hypothetical protein